MFNLDVIVLNFLRDLFNSSYTQFITILSIFLVVTVICPEKKKNDN